MKNKHIQHLYEMSSIDVKDSNLPRLVWVSPKGRTQHGPRIKVADGLRGHNLVASITIGDTPILSKGNLPAKIFSQISKWIVLNREVLLDYWYGRITTKELHNTLRHL